MPLQGDLKEFGVTEIFQLLEQQGKTGCLFLKIESGQTEVYFRDGKIVGAIPDGLSPVENLMRTLDKQGLLTGPEAGRIREAYKKDLRRFRDILQQQNILPPAELELLLKEQIKDLLFPLFASKKGSFLFDADRTLSAEWSLQEPMAAEPIILEALRRNDEWPLVKQRIGPLRAVPRRRFVGDTRGKETWEKGIVGRLLRWREMAAPDLPDKDLFPQEANGLSSAEKMVYNMIDGKRTLEQVLLASSLGEYATCKALLALSEQGWIRIDREETPQGAAGAGVARRDLGKWVWGTAALILVVLGVSFFSHSSRITWIQDLTGKGGRPVCRLLNHHQRVRVARAVDLYREENGSVPSRLSDLVQARLLREGDLSLWGDNRLTYQAEPPESYRLIIVPSP